MSGNLCRCGAYANIVAGGRERGRRRRMKPFEYAAPGRRRRGGRAVAGRPRRAVFLAGGTNLVDHLKLGVARPDAAGRRPPPHLPRDRRRRRRRAADRRGRHQQRPGRRPPGPRALPGAGRGAAGRRHRSAAQPRHDRRQPAAAHPLRVLPGRHHPVQQARARQRLLGRRRLHPLPRHPRSPPTTATCIATHPSDMAVALAALDAAGPGRSARPASAPLPFADLHRLPGDDPAPRHRARARRADHRDRPAAAAAGRPVDLPQGARPRVLRLRAGLGRRRGRRSTTARSGDVRHRARRRRAQALARHAGPRTAAARRAGRRRRLPRGGSTPSSPTPCRSRASTGQRVQDPAADPHRSSPPCAT